jgi:hypothetical protein
MKNAYRKFNLFRNTLILAPTILFLAQFLITNSWLFSKNAYLIDDQASAFIGSIKVFSLHYFKGIPSWNGYWYPAPYWLIVTSPFARLSLLFHGPNTLTFILMKIVISLIGTIVVSRIIYRKTRSYPFSVLGSALWTYFVAIQPDMSKGLWEQYLVGESIAITILLIFECFYRKKIYGLLWSIYILGLLGSMSWVAYFSYTAVLVFFVALYLLSVNSSKLIPLSLRWIVGSKLLKSKKFVMVFLVLNLALYASPLMDLLFEHGQNLHSYLSWQRAASSIGRLSLSDSFFRVLHSLTSLHQSTLISLLIIFSFVNIKRKLYFRELLQSLAPLVLTFIAVYFFVAFGSYKGYSPAEVYLFLPYIFLATSVISICSALEVRFGAFERGSKKIILRTSFAAVICTLIYLTSTLNYLVPLNSYEKVESKGLSTLAKNLEKANRPIPIFTDFLEFNSSKAIDNVELPWRYTDGLAAVLTANGVEYCIVPGTSERAIYGAKIMTMHTYSRYCEPKETNNPLSLGCDKTTQQLVATTAWDHRKYLLGPCHT